MNSLGLCGWVCGSYGCVPIGVHTRAVSVGFQLVMHTSTESCSRVHAHVFSYVHVCAFHRMHVWLGRARVQGGRRENGWPACMRMCARVCMRVHIHLLSLVGPRA